MSRIYNKLRFTFHMHSLLYQLQKISFFNIQKYVAKLVIKFHFQLFHRFSIVFFSIMFKGSTFHTNDVLTKTQKVFGEYIEPTIIQKIQFNKLFKSRRSVGEGSYGQIKCVQNCYNELYAIKQSKDNQELYGLYREVSVMKKFNHPNILKVIGFYQIKESAKLILLTQFCKYKSLKDYSPYLQSLPQIEKYQFALDIFKGIYAMHSKNIMHRDLKPQNILIDANLNAKICDFGFSKIDLSQDLSNTKKVGTPLYNSPQTEQGSYTKKCDIYSYGLIVYFIFTNGKHLFKKFDTCEDLKSARKQHFKLGINAYKQLNLPADVQELLQNTITEKESNRYDFEKISNFWRRTIIQKNMNHRAPRESMQDQKIKKFTDGETLNNSEKLAIQLTKRIEENLKMMDISSKIQKLDGCLRQIEGGISLFKKEIQQAELKLPQKHIISFGSLLILQIHLQNLLSVGISLLKSLENRNYFLVESIDKSLYQILLMRQALGKNIIKTTKYLRTHKFLIKPIHLLSINIEKSLQETNKIELLLSQLFGNHNGIEGFKTFYRVDSNQSLYLMIQENYQLNIDLLTFKQEFDLMLAKFRRQKINASRQEEIIKVNKVVQKIKSLNC